MPKIIMLKGLPGSGKSTWANQYVTDHPNAVRVNKDDLRRMLRGAKWNKALEPGVLVTRDNIVSWALANGRDVIVDDTNFALKHEKRLMEIACTMEAEFEMKFIDTPLKECIKNDLKRPVSVGEKVIRRMYNEFLAEHRPKQNWTIGLPKAVIVDIDGTVALHVDRNPYDTSKYETDIPNKPIVAMVQEFERQGFKILFVSGRDKEFFDVTAEWIMTHVFSTGVPQGFGLMMRPQGDRREDSIVKQEIYDQYIKGKWNVFAVLDDRNRVVEMWRRMGLTCFQVAEGDF